MYHVKTYNTKIKCGLNVCNGLIRVKNIKYMYTLLLQINKNIVCVSVWPLLLLYVFVIFKRKGLSSQNLMSF